MSSEDQARRPPDPNHCIGHLVGVRHNVLADNETFRHKGSVPRSTTIMHKFWRSAAESLIASLALILLTVAFYRLHFNLATASPLYVIVIVLLSRIGSFVSSIVASIVAALCLAHLAPPAYSFRVDDPLDYVAIAAFMVTSFIIASLVSRVRKQTEETLSSVSYKAIEAEEHERQRIAKDLHDGIGQRVTLLIIEVEQLKADSLNGVEMANRIDGLLKQSLEILTHVKTLAHELYSPRLEYLGIAGVMGSFCKDFREQQRVEIDFRSHGLPNFVPLDISLCLFRVLQVALHNAVEHSGVRNFDVRLNGTSDEIHLTVGDCGVGFDLEMASKAGGLGLNHMRERLKLVKGTLSIDSQPKRGTTVHARVPLRLGSDYMGAAR
jgi:signal transduction histidine kinase